MAYNRAVLVHCYSPSVGRECCQPKNTGSCFLNYEWPPDILVSLDVVPSPNDHLFHSGCLPGQVSIILKAKPRAPLFSAQVAVADSHALDNPTPRYTRYKTFPKCYVGRNGKQNQQKLHIQVCGSLKTQRNQVCQG